MASCTKVLCRAIDIDTPEIKPQFTTYHGRARSGF